MTEKDLSRAIGGNARADALTPERKAEIAKQGALARWGVKALKKGNFQKEFGIDVDCYVLDDEQKTAVISQNGLARTIGLSKRGRVLERFLSSKTLFDNGGAELLEKLLKPIKFQWGTGGAEQPPSIVHGFEVGLLIDICNLIIRVEKKLHERQKRIIDQAHIVVNASAKLGIRDLVYALSGFDITRESVIQAFKVYVQNEAREYEKEFPDQLYTEWYRLYNLTPPAQNKPWKFKHLTVGHVYWPLAQSSGKVLQLTRAQRGEEKKKKLHQFLSEVGVKTLRTQLGQVLGIARISKSKDEYEKYIREQFGDQQELPL